MGKYEEALEKYAKYVVQQSRSNLTKKGNKASGDLYKSLGFEVTDDNITFTGEEYGLYQDQGVRGKNAYYSASANSPFRFGTGTGRKGGLTQGIDKWVRQKGFQFRDRKSGKFLSYQSTAYLITRSIFHKGIKPSLFFTKPFEAGYKKYIDVDLIKAFGQDIETMVDYNLKDIK